MAALGAALAGAVWWSVETPGLLPVVTAAVLASVMVLFSSLTVTVGEGAMRVLFGPGLIRRTIPLRRIREVHVVRTPWYYGWGIRWTPDGPLWNVSGLDGVELRFDDGRRFRVGSDEPNRLADALRRAMRHEGDVPRA